MLPATGGVPRSPPCRPSQTGRARLGRRTRPNHQRGVQAVHRGLPRRPLWNETAWPLYEASTSSSWLIKAVANLLRPSRSLGSSQWLAAYARPRARRRSPEAWRWRISGCSVVGRLSFHRGALRRRLRGNGWCHVRHPDDPIGMLMHDRISSVPLRTRGSMAAFRSGRPMAGNYGTSSTCRHCLK